MTDQLTPNNSSLAHGKDTNKPKLNHYQQIAEFINAGLSLIPVGSNKVPFSGWKQFQTERQEFGAVVNGMDRNATDNVAIISGRVSGKLEVIDIDTKHKTGCDAPLFATINQIYPALFQKLRIHKAPSGGYHILYKISDGEVPCKYPKNSTVQK